MERAYGSADLDSGALGAFVTAELQKRARLNDGRQPTYARGLYIVERRGVREVSHGGATAGYRAWLGRWPDQKLSVALLCNAGDANGDALAYQVADLYLPPAPPPTPPRAASETPTAPPADAAARAGVFVNMRTGGPLRLLAGAQGLRTASGTGFTSSGPDRVRSAESEIIFHGPDRLSLVSPQGTDVLTRVQPWTPTPAELAALAGVYRSDEAAATYRASVDGTGLMLRLDGLADKSIALKVQGRDMSSGPGVLVRVHRDAAGRPQALAFVDPRVADLRFARVR